MSPELEHAADAPASPARLLIPELRTLRELRAVLARGGLPARRTAESQARIAAFRTVEELLRLLDEYRERVERGARCRLVEREHGREPGRLLLELRIEEGPGPNRQGGDHDDARREEDACDDAGPGCEGHERAPPRSSALTSTRTRPSNLTRSSWRRASS